MSELNLQLDRTAENEMQKLMNHYQVNNRAELISKALRVLKIVASVQQTNGELIARNGKKETSIVIR